MTTSGLSIEVSTSSSSCNTRRDIDGAATVCATETTDLHRYHQVSGFSQVPFRDVRMPSQTSAASTHSSNGKATETRMRWNGRDCCAHSFVTRLVHWPSVLASADPLGKGERFV